MILEPRKANCTNCDSKELMCGTGLGRNNNGNLEMLEYWLCNKCDYLLKKSISDEEEIL